MLAQLEEVGISCLRYAGMAQDAAGVGSFYVGNNMEWPHLMEQALRDLERARQQGIISVSREAELIAIFRESTRLEADFWEMGWRAGQRVE